MRTPRGTTVGHLDCTLAQQAKGVFIIPLCGRAAVAGGDCSDPAFCNMIGPSPGSWAGAMGGAVALVLMNERAANDFVQKNNFSLNTQGRADGAEPGPVPSRHRWHVRHRRVVRPQRTVWRQGDDDLRCNGNLTNA